MKTTLFKPFEKYSENTLLIVGVLATVLGSYLAVYFNMRFDGALDAHSGVNVTISQVFLDNLINIGSLALFLFIIAKYLNSKTRIIDIIATVLIARIPIYLLSFINMKGIISETTTTLLKNIDPNAIDMNKIPSFSTQDIVALMVIGVFGIVFLVWYVALLYNGYKTASNAKGNKAIWLFILALFLAEILSKILIVNFK